ncbi:hypothetical protein M0R01_03750 [bacterium]|nr:hypothetical protein [bacterium]
MTPHQVDVERQTPAQDDTGGYDDSTYSTIYENLKCRIASVESLYGNKNIGYAKEMFSGMPEVTAVMMASTKLDNMDRITFGDTIYEIRKIYPVYAFRKLHHYTYGLKQITI